MTREDIIRMAREAGIGDTGNRCGFVFYQPGTAALERFAALIAAAEREACAKVAERYEPDEKTSYVTYASSAIRARGEK